jgi:GNAT superfamily N-acetyltransferase
VAAFVRAASARSAVSSDLEAVEQLRRSALEEQAPLRGGDLYRVREASRAVADDDPGRRLWVGVLADAVVGYLSGRVDTVADGRRLGIVEGVYVDLGCRAVGVGEAMMAAAIAWFRGEGCVGVDALALPGARATKNFFEESGFTSRLLVMHHRL